MASVLFTALALIAAGQAGNVPSGAGEAQLRSPATSQAEAAAPKGNPGAARTGLRRRG